MIWFSSDFHLGHTNIVGPKVSKWPKGYRTFDSVQEMDSTIINTINNYVQYDDTLYFLGDFTFSPQWIRGYRTRILVQEFHLLRGNHDKKVYNDTDFFTSISDVMLLTEGKETIFMSHYAHRVWPHSHHGSIHLYGHSHGSLPPQGKSLDVGIDSAYQLFGEYRPFSLEEVIRIANKAAISTLDHHVL